MGRFNRGRVLQRSPNLQQEIIQDDAALAALSVGMINKVLDIAKEVGAVILRLIIIDLVGQMSVSTTPNFVHCALISKPKSEGVPVANDFFDPKYCVTEYALGLGLTGHNPGYHWRQNLKIMVPAVNDVYLACNNTLGQIATCAYYVRLFWQST